jgi:hypothetical protein
MRGFASDVREEEAFHSLDGMPFLVCQAGFEGCKGVRRLRIGQISAQIGLRNLCSSRRSEKRKGG